MLKPGHFIRRMTERDLDAVMEIENEVFSLPWSRKSYATELNNKWATYLVCDVDGEVAAYCGMWVVFDEAHITNVAVGKGFRHRGCARALMEAMERIALDKKAMYISLEVRPSNLAALALYQGLGYVQTGCRKGYYQDNQEDALIMTNPLLPADIRAGCFPLRPERD